MANRFFAGEVGTVVSLECGITISAATTLRIYYTKPDGTAGYWTGSISGTTKITYTTVAATDIDVAGQWSLRSYAVISGNARWGDPVMMTVESTATTNYPLTTVEEAIAYLGATPEKDAFWIYCSAADASAATVEIKDLTAVLTITGGTSAATTTITYTTATTNTMSEMVAYINTVSGWAAGLVCHADADTSDLIPTGAVSVLGSANEATFKVKDTLLVERLIDRATDYIERYCGRKLKARAYAREIYSGNGARQLMLRNYPVSRVSRVSEGRQSVFYITKTGATNFASIEVTPTQVRLNSDGTVTALTLTTYATIADLITAIEAVSGWDCTLMSSGYGTIKTYYTGPDGSASVAETLPMAATDCKSPDIAYVEMPHEEVRDYRLIDQTTDEDANAGILYNAGGWARGNQNYQIDYLAGFTQVPYALEMACLELIKYKYSQSTRDSSIKSESLGDFSFTLADVSRGLPDDLKASLDLFRQRRV